MILFDANKVTFELVRLKSCTTALGGSLRVLDRAKSTDTKEVYRKVDAPMSIIRLFQKEKKASQYLNPLLVCLTKYDDHVVAMECHELGAAGEEESEGVFGDIVRWKSKSEQNFENVKKTIEDDDRDWYFDGTFAYTYAEGDTVAAAQNGAYLSQDGLFRSVQADTIKFSAMQNREALEIQPRTCLAFVTSTGQTAVTAPIWKDLGDAGKSKLKNDEDNDDAQRYTFDDIEQHLAVNLGFVLKAGTDVADLFGFEAVDCLQIPKLMLQLKTVNLTSVPKSIKMTFNAGIKFKHAAAWLMGLSTKVETLEQYAVVRSLLKYLTTKGTYRSDTFQSTSVYHKDQNSTAVKLISKEDALKNAKVEVGPIGALSNDRNVLGTLYAAE